MPGSLSRSYPATAGSSANARGDERPGADELGLDAVAVGVEVAERRRDRGGEVAGQELAVQRPVGDRRPGRGAVPAGGRRGAAAALLGRAGQRVAPGVLVHVQHGVDAVRLGRGHRGLDLRRGRPGRTRPASGSSRDQDMPSRTTLKPIAAIWAKSASVSGCVGRDRRIAQVVVDQLVHVDAAQDHLPAGDVADGGQPAVARARAAGAGAPGRRSPATGATGSAARAAPALRSRAGRPAGARRRPATTTARRRERGVHGSDAERQRHASPVTTAPTSADRGAVAEPGRDADQRGGDPPAVRPGVGERCDRAARRRRRRPRRGRTRRRSRPARPSRRPTAGLAGAAAARARTVTREDAEEHGHAGQDARARRRRRSGATSGPANA